MKAEGEGLAEAFAGAIIELARGGPAEDIGQGVPAHRAAVALAHRHISQLVPARERHANKRKHDLSAKDLSPLHPPVTPACTRGRNQVLIVFSLHEVWRYIPSSSVPPCLRKKKKKKPKSSLSLEREEHRLHPTLFLLALAAFLTDLKSGR